jgi:hypothetical protein
MAQTGVQATTTKQHWQPLHGRQLINASSLVDLKVVVLPHTVDQRDSRWAVTA